MAGFLLFGKFESRESFVNDDVSFILMFSSRSDGVMKYFLYLDLDALGMFQKL